MSVDFEQQIRDAAAKPTRSFDVDRAYRRGRRHRVGAITAGCALVIAGVVGVTGLVRPDPAPIIDTPPDVASEPDMAPSATPSPTCERHLVESAPPTHDLWRQATSQAMEAAEDGVMLRWSDVDFDPRGIEDRHERAMLREFIEGRCDAAVLDAAGYASMIAKRIAGTWKPAPPPFDARLLLGPDGHDQDGRAWYVTDDPGNEIYATEVLDTQLGPIIDDLCVWMTDEYERANATYLQQVEAHPFTRVDAARHERLYVGSFVGALLEGVAGERVGDGLGAWIMRQCGPTWPVPADEVPYTVEELRAVQDEIEQVDWHPDAPEALQGMAMALTEGKVHVFIDVRYEHVVPTLKERFGDILEIRVPDVRDSVKAPPEPADR